MPELKFLDGIIRLKHVNLLDDEGISLFLRRVDVLHCFPWFGIAVDVPPARKQHILPIYRGGTVAEKLQVILVPSDKVDDVGSLNPSLVCGARIIDDSRT